MTAAPSARMLTAWRRTEYGAAGAAIRLGRRSPALEALLPRRGAAFLTAWNPMGRRRPEGWNRRMQARLCERLRGLPRHVGFGRLGAWREEHLLVVVDLRRAVVLARHFRQLGILVLRPGGRARLITLAYH
ncbi:MAG TPA: DUF3293 domain-containing protein [Acetobacteraceae bacterium]|nr:DUF3293 domain-containing protein [Acetobacteraceae bacterium]